MQFIAKNFNNDYIDIVPFGDVPILYERNNWTGDVWYENDWLYGDKPIKLTGVSESGSRISYKALEFSIKSATDRFSGGGSVTLGLK
jgi:hypothetical protein